MNTMRELWDEARRYGSVYIHTHDNGTYVAKITFSTIPGCSLDVDSRYGIMCKDPEEALKKVIAKAKEVVDSMSPKKEDKPCSPTSLLERLSNKIQS